MINAKWDCLLWLLGQVADRRCPAVRYGQQLTARQSTKLFNFVRRRRSAAKNDLKICGHLKMADDSTSNLGP